MDTKKLLKAISIFFLIIGALVIIISCGSGYPAFSIVGLSQMALAAFFFVIADLSEDVKEIKKILKNKY
ncbi:hypothetical protein [Cyanobacterium aponinum]|uniref:hypothetical protein n=1 Tax=Cyanobacterium aponinum TaxID=379064 RepID=UPI000C12E0FB|nr:hypothetical protein [Cyanobacterium aponinum]PHV61939.1 hypothetical protein CSQ80_12895 [Cyanobacterium aponinum IPPAS B-1201]